MKPYIWYVVFGFFATILPVVMELTVPRLLQFIIDQGIRPGRMDMIMRGVLLMFGAAGVGAIATLGQGVCRAQISQGIAFDLRHELFTHIQHLSFGNLDQMHTGRLMTRVSSDVDQVRLFSSAGLALLLRVLLMIIGSIIMLFITDWQLALIVIGVVAIAGIFIRSIFKIAGPLFNRVQQRLSSLNTIIQENLAGVQVVKAYVRERYEIDRFEEKNVDYMTEHIRVGRWIALAMPVLTLLTNGGVVLVLWFGGLDVIGGRLSIGELVAFNNYLMIGMTPLLFLGNLLAMLARADVSAARVLEVLDTKPLLKVAPSPHTSQMKGQVVFNNVSFHYGSTGSAFGPDPDNGQVELDQQRNGHRNSHKNGHQNGRGQGRGAGAGQLHG